MVTRIHCPKCLGCGQLPGTQEGYVDRCPMCGGCGYLEQLTSAPSKRLIPPYRCQRCGYWIDECSCEEGYLFPEDSTDEGRQETDHLLSSPCNAARLMRSIAQERANANLDAAARVLFLRHYVDHEGYSTDWAERYWDENANAPHKGDCPHAEHQGPITCDRCVCDQFRADARTAIDTWNTCPLPNITRVEVIDHSPIEDHPPERRPRPERGGVWGKWNLKEVELAIQDEGRTLKVFVK